MKSKTKKWLEEWIDNDSNQANVKEKAIIYYRARRNVNTVDRLVNYCSDKNFKIIEVYKILACIKRGSKKFLFNMLAFINTQKGRIHIVCDDFYDIFQDEKDLPILESLITTGKIAIHILKQNFIIDKDDYNGAMIKFINLMLIVKHCSICTLSNNIKVAQSHIKQSS